MVSRSPSYAQALKTGTRPAPIQTSFQEHDGSLSSASSVPASQIFTIGSAPTTGVTSPDLSRLHSSTSPASPSATQSATIPKKLSWELSTTEGASPSRIQAAAPAFLQRRGPIPPSPLSVLGLQLDNSYPADNRKQAVTTGATSITTFPSSGRLSPTAYKFQQQNLFDAQTSPFVTKASDSTANTFPLPQYPFGSARDLADQHRILPNNLRSPSSGTSYNVPIGAERKALETQIAPQISPKVDITVQAPQPSPTKIRPDSAGGLQNNGDKESEYSAVTKFEPSSGPVLLVNDAEVVQQEPHPRSFTRHMRHKHIPEYLDCAFDSAYLILKTVNGDYFELPARVSSRRRPVLSETC